MRIERKIILLWGVYLLLSFASLALPHRSLPLIALINYGLQVLLGIICVFVVIHDSSRTKPIFINFAVLFFFAIPLLVSAFVGPLLFSSVPFMSVYYHQYVNMIGVPLLLAFSVLYTAVDYVGRRLRTSHKYLLTAGIVFSIFFSLYLPYVVDPLHLYRTSDYTEYMLWNEVYDKAVEKFDREPGDQELIELFATTHPHLNSSQSEGSLRHGLKEYKPYLGGRNSTILFWQPLNINVLYVNALLIATIGLIFVIKQIRDYPHAAYVEKILQTFLVLCSFEFLHYWAYAQSSSYEIFRAVLEFGQYVTILIFLVMVYVFSMRLRFVLSALGKYYETVLATQPSLVTRYRDEIDNVVLRYFFRSKKYFGRLASVEPNHLHSTNKKEHQP